MNLWILLFLFNLYFCYYIYVNNIEILDVFEGFFVLYIKCYKVIINEWIFGLLIKVEMLENWWNCMILENKIKVFFFLKKGMVFV